MIQAFSENINGGQLMLIGLSLENIRRLMSGEPILTTEARNHGVQIDIMIFYGITEEYIEHLLRERGLIGEDTKVEHRNDR